MGKGMAEGQIEKQSGSSLISSWSCGAVRGCCTTRPEEERLSQKLRDDINQRPSGMEHVQPGPASMNEQQWASPGALGSPVAQQASAQKEKVTAVLIKKASKDLRLGVRLAARKDGSTTGVEVIDVHPDGPLANVIQKGDILLRSALTADHGSPSLGACHTS